MERQIERAIEELEKEEEFVIRSVLEMSNDGSYVYDWELIERLLEYLRQKDKVKTA